MQQLKFKIKETESASVEIVPCADGGVEIIINYGSETQKNNGSSNNKPKKTYTYHNTEETIEALRKYCTDRIKEEPEWKEDIKRFGKFYADKVNNGWKGELRIDDLFNNWCKKRNKI